MRASCVTGARLPPWSDGRSPICPCTPYGRHWWLSCSRRRSATVETWRDFNETGLLPLTVRSRHRRDVVDGRAEFDSDPRPDPGVGTPTELRGRVGQEEYVRRGPHANGNAARRSLDRDERAVEVPHRRHVRDGGPGVVDPRSHSRWAGLDRVRTL